MTARSYPTLTWSGIRSESLEVATVREPGGRYCPRAWRSHDGGQIVQWPSSAMASKLLLGYEFGEPPTLGGLLFLVVYAVAPSCAPAGRDRASERFEMTGGTHLAGRSNEPRRRSPNTSKAWPNTASPSRRPPALPKSSRTTPTPCPCWCRCHWPRPCDDGNGPLTRSPSNARGRRHSRELPTLHLQKGAAGHRKNAQKPARAFFGPAGLPPVAQR
jgi:hypothetical protein